MYLHGYGTNMMMSNNKPFIEKILKNISGKYYLANYDKKIIKNGYFLGGLLNGKGNIIDYSRDNLHILYGIFIDDEFDKHKYNYSVTTKAPYFSFINESTCQKEYYASITIHVNNEETSNMIDFHDKFLQIFINSEYDTENTIYQVRLIKNLTLHDTYKKYKTSHSIKDLINS
jgi:hypothetical protein